MTIQLLTLLQRLYDILGEAGYAYRGPDQWQTMDDLAAVIRRLEDAETQDALRHLQTRFQQADQSPRRPRWSNRDLWATEKLLNLLTAKGGT